MNDKNKELLEAVIEDKLEKSLKEDLDPEEREKIFKEAMLALDKDLEDEKTKTNGFLKMLELGGLFLLVPIGDYIARDRFAKKCMDFERTDSFTTTPGRSLSSLFKFRK